MRVRWLILTAALLGLGHWALQHDTASWLPLPITAATVVAFTAKRPLRYLVGLAVASELLSTLPGGIVTLVVLFPWLIQKLSWHREREVWLAWLAVSAATVLGQLVILLSVDWIGGMLSVGWGLQAAWRYVPWPAVGITWLASSLVIFLITAGHRLFLEPTYER